MNRTYLRGLALLALIMLCSAIAPGGRLAVAAADRPVMAFYYPWYEPSDWTYDRMSDLAAPTYSSGDDATLNRHIQQADDAGIDALICAWFGPNEERLNKRCRHLMDLAEASGRDLKIAIMPEQAAWAALNSVGALTEALGVLQREFMNRPATSRFAASRWCSGSIQTR